MAAEPRCSPTSPASLNVLVGPGEIYALENVDSAAYGSLAADLTHSIVKQGILLNALQFALTAPVTVGYSINYLIEAELSEAGAIVATRPFHAPPP